MTRPVITFAPEIAILDMVRLLELPPALSIPVVEQGKVCGMVSNDLLARTIPGKVADDLNGIKAK